MPNLATLRWIWDWVILQITDTVKLDLIFCTPFPFDTVKTSSQRLPMFLSIGMPVLRVKTIKLAMVVIT